MTTREDAVNAMKADNEFVSKKGDTEGLTKIMNAELNREFAPGKLRKSMRSANTDVIPELREHKSVPYGGGKEQRLTHGGKVVKTRVGNHDGKVGNSDTHEGGGKNIGDVVADDEVQMFSKVQTKPWQKQTKSSNTAKIYQLEERIFERPRPSGKFEFVASSIKIKSDAVWEPGFETNSDENSTVLGRDCSEDVDKFAELGDMKVEAGYDYDRFGVEGEAETDIPAEKETQSEWSLKECQEMLGEVTAEENKNGGIRTAAESSAVLFLLLYDCMLLARDYMAMKQQQRDLDKGMDMDIQLNPEQQIQSSRLSSTHDVEEDPAKAVKKLI